MPSAYKTVDGKSCEVELLELGEKLTRGKSLTLEGARSIWANALDGNKITERERNSIQHIIKSSPHGLTKEARDFFEYWLNEKHVTKLKGAKLEVVDGVKCDTAIMQTARHFHTTDRGRLNVRAAEGVWFAALDGRGVTNREKDTLSLILGKYKFEGPAKAFLESKLAWLSVAAEAVAADGAPALPEAMLLTRCDALALSDLPPPPTSTLPPSTARSTRPQSASSAPPLPPPSTAPPLPPPSAPPPSTLSSTPGLRGGQLQPLQSPFNFLGSLKRRVQALLLGPAPEQPSAERPAKRQRRQPGLTLDNLRAAFEKCDVDKDGKINKRELIKACREHAEIAQLFELPQNIRQEDGSRTRFEEFFQGVDADGDREICWAELLARYRHLVSDF